MCTSASESNLDNTWPNDSCATLAHLQALMSSLHETGVQPTLVLQHGGRTRAGEEQPCAWTCAVHTGAAALHAVREAGAQQGLGDSVLGPALATAQVASIAGLLMGSKLPRNGSVVLGGLPLL
jgi:hypothetical protein